MTYMLGYEKHDDENKQTENRRNGDVTLQIPWDRDSEFEPVVVKKHQKNVTGIEDQILALYAKGVTKCIVHQIRNLIRYVSYKDVKKITSALKPIYKASSEEVAQGELSQFEKVWGEKYPLIIRSWRQNWAEIATFFKYPPEIRILYLAIQDVLRK